MWNEETLNAMSLSKFLIKKNAWSSQAEQLHSGFQSIHVLEFFHTAIYVRSKDEYYAETRIRMHER